MSEQRTEDPQVIRLKAAILWVVFSLGTFLGIVIGIFLR